MQDDAFWALTDAYESGKITSDDVLNDICRSTKSYEVATADFVMVVQRPMTKEEKEKIKEKIYAKNSKRGTQSSKTKNGKR